MSIARCVLATYGFTAIQALVVAIAQNRDLRRGFFRPAVQHFENRPVLAGIQHHAHVSPGQWNAIASIYGTQVARRIRVKIVPMPVRRNARHASHYQRRRQIDLAARIDGIRVARKKLPKRNFRAEQRSRKVAALEIAPGIQNILGVHVRRFRIMSPPGNPAARYLWRPCAVATVQYPVGYVIRQIVLEAFRRLFQVTIQEDDIGGLIE